MTSCSASSSRSRKMRLLAWSDRLLSSISRSEPLETFSSSASTRASRPAHWLTPTSLAMITRSTPPTRKTQPTKTTSVTNANTHGASDSQSEPSSTLSTPLPIVAIIANPNNAHRPIWTIRTSLISHP